jgi:uncharacterized protein (DUF58 family)
MSLPDLPLSTLELDRLRFGLRRSVPSEGLGAHLRRKQGQSLEFREFRGYQFGDDIRKVDWRASARTGRSGPQIVRTFEAEERLTVAIVVDVRPALRLPLSAPKLLFALWLAMAICELVSRERDDVLFSTLFGPEDDRPVLWRKGSAAARMRVRAGEIWSRPAGDMDALRDARTEELCRRLRPASVVVLISDMLFADGSGAVERLARLAQAQRRELVVAEVDSFAHERLAALSEARPRRLASVEGRGFGPDPVLLGEEVFAQAADRISALRTERRSRWTQGGMTWANPIAWPEPPEAQPPDWSENLDLDRAARTFHRIFPALPMLRTLLSRGPVG